MGEAKRRKERGEYPDHVRYVPGIIEVADESGRSHLAEIDRKGRVFGVQLVRGRRIEDRTIVEQVRARALREDVEEISAVAETETDVVDDAENDDALVPGEALEGGSGE